jgi:hypothetical protein
MGGCTMVGAAAGAVVGAAALGAAVEPASKDDTTSQPVRPDADDSGNPT